MKIYIKLTTCFVLFACSSTIQKDETGVPNKLAEQITTLEDKSNDTNCVRGVPEAAIDTTILKNSEFSIVSHTRATETVGLENGDRLIIEHSGCEYFVQTYKFETSLFDADIKDLEFWYKRTIELINNIKSANTSPFDLTKCISSLNYYTSNVPEKHLGDEINFGDNEIPAILTMDKIKKLENSKFLVEITLSLGPL